jgi:fructose-1,6-bisphosphatase/inositol monophosphatase family enzyme
MLDVDVPQDKYLIYSKIDLIIHRCINVASQVILDSNKSLIVNRKFDNDNPDYDEVTSADFDSQAAIVDIIQTSMPEAGILCEENDFNIPTKNGFTFVVDPIDGTEEFVRQGNEVSIMIACVYEGRVIATAIHNPYTNERYFLLAHENKCYRTRKPFEAIKNHGGQLLEYKRHPRNLPLLSYDDARSDKFEAQGYLSTPKIGFFFPHFVVGGSYGTNMMKLASNQVCAVITSAYKVKPWDALPVFGILENLGYRSYQLQDNGTWKHQRLRMDLEPYNEGLLLITMPGIYEEMILKIFKDGRAMGQPGTRV